MATSGPTAVTNFLAGDVEFRAFAQALHDKLAACGLVQTADTGQINLATVTRPAALNTVAGYEIWRFADALQATLPVYIKVEYGVASATDRPSLWVQVATGTNGAGALTGQASNRTQAAQTAASTAAGSTGVMLAQGDTGQIHFLMNDTIGQPGNPGMFGLAVERPRDGAGNKTADGFLVAFLSSAGAAFQVVPATGTIPGASSNSFAQPESGRTVMGADVTVSPVLVFIGKVFYCLMGIMLPADLAAQNVFPMTALGAAHNFRTVRVSNTYCMTIPWE